MAKVTFCVLTYGDHLPLVRRAIESIRAHCPRDEYRLVVGANAASSETADYLWKLFLLGHIDRLVESSTNVNKCPMMRRMFEGIETDFIWWFDDDSFIQDSSAFQAWLARAEAALPPVVMWGRLCVCNHADEFTDMPDPARFVRSASWYRGLPPPSWKLGGKAEFNFKGRGTGDGRWFFIVGGCWLIRTSAMRALDWPDPRLIKLGDDVFLGEAIRQQGWNVCDNGYPGIALNTAPRRGDPGSIKISPSRKFEAAVKPAYFSI